MIDEKKLIEALRLSNSHHASNSREQALLDRVVRIVEEQPKIDFISVEERLPSKNGIYLVTFYRYSENKLILCNDLVKGYEEKITTTAFFDVNQKIWQVYNVSQEISDNEIYVNALVNTEEMDCINGFVETILAWMPLPEPYKGDE